MPPPEQEGSLAYAYEAVFCIFLTAIAFLGREEASWAYPQVLYLLVLLLALNLAAGFALRRWPGRRSLSAGVILANCGVITAILHFSGGRQSLLWVLYLLPVFTASMFLTGKEAVWIAVGAVAFNVVFCAFSITAWDAAAYFDLGLRAGVLILAAALTWRMAERERRALGQVRAQRSELAGLLEQVEQRETQDLATRRLAEVGLVTAGVLHDLKTPLTVILGSCDIGLRDGDVAATRADLERIKSAGLLCREIVNQVLAVSGQAQPSSEPCDMSAVLRETLAMCEPVAQKKRVAVHCSLPEEALPLRGSFQQLQRLFLNLVSNAIQAMPTGGELTITAAQVPPPIAGLPPRIQVSVCDDGPGLSDEALAGLFKPFSTTKSAQGGTGLGLYICREIAMSHRGSLHADNQPQGGARFVVTLPLEQVQASPDCELAEKAAV